MDLEGNASSNGGSGRSGGSAARDSMRTCQNADSYVELEMKCCDGGKSRRLVIIKEIELENYVATSNHNVMLPNLHHPVQIAK